MSGLAESLQAIQSESSGSVAVVSGAGAGLEGAYVQLIAATAILPKWFSITAARGAGAGVSALFDIADGAGGSEVDRIIDQFFAALRSSDVGYRIGAVYPIPFQFPVGSRLAVRIQDNTVIAENYTFGVTIYG